MEDQELMSAAYRADELARACGKFTYYAYVYKDNSLISIRELKSDSLSKLVKKAEKLVKDHPEYCVRDFERSTGYWGRTEDMNIHKPIYGEKYNKANEPERKIFMLFDFLK
jgi:hypothetical protein